VSYAYPLMLDVTHRQAVIIGGGAVAARKARGLREAGCAKVRVVAAQFTAELPEGVEKVTKSYEASDLQDADLVFAATDSSQVNEAIIHDAARLKILSCRADFDEKSGGDFSNPAVMRMEAGAITIAVSASGSPALAVQVRDDIANQMIVGWGALARLMVGVRPVIRNCKVIGFEQRSRLFLDLATPEAKSIFEKGGGPALWQWLSDKHPFVRGIDELRLAIVEPVLGK